MRSDIPMFFSSPHAYPFEHWHSFQRKIISLVVSSTSCYEMPENFCLLQFYKWFYLIPIGFPCTSLIICCSDRKTLSFAFSHSIFNDMHLHTYSLSFWPSFSCTIRSNSIRLDRYMHGTENQCVQQHFVQMLLSTIYFFPLSLCVCVRAYWYVVYRSREINLA